MDVEWMWVHGPQQPKIASYAIADDQITKSQTAQLYMTQVT